MYALTLDETNTNPAMIAETGYIIDIQYTMPGSWILWGNDSESTVGAIIESNRTETEDGWFVVSFTNSATTEINIKYRFKDGNRDVLECLVDSSDNSEKTIPCLLIRIPESRALTITT